MKTLFLWLMMVLILSVMFVDDSMRRSVANADKLLHFIIYAITGILFYVEFLRVRNPGIRKRAMWLAVLCASGYGFLMEIVQSFLPHRTFSLLDAEVNVLGVAIGLLFFRFGRRRAG